MKTVRLTAQYYRPARHPDRFEHVGPQQVIEYRSASLYNVGEIATFANDEADELIAAGMAVEVTP